jgi:SAP domain-containing ribonucleoprotein
MADYSQQKVPDLKKLLQERGLVVSGNKADLVARLQEDDNKKWPMTYAHMLHICIARGC